MKVRYLLATMVPAFALAVSSPAFAESVKGVVKSLDTKVDNFIIDPEEEGASPLTFILPDGQDLDDFLNGIDVGDEVLVDYDSEFCDDNPDCDGVAKDIEEL